jgi:3-deoxy-D-manno-octulosonate 8-phosphate phosphatase (KDO 8-P phosphatase)
MKERLQKVKMLLLDVDGVLTDGRIIYSSDGTETKAFDVKDGHGLKMIQRAGIKVGIITGRQSTVVEHRAKELGINIVYQGVKDKLVPFREILDTCSISEDEIAYVGDDIVDLPILLRVGFAATVADALPEVRERVHYVSDRMGGKAAVREICDLILKESGRWDSVAAKYFQL